MGLSNLLMSLNANKLNFWALFERRHLRELAARLINVRINSERGTVVKRS